MTASSGRPAYAVIAATCYGNRGAQAMLETVVGTLSGERPDARFHVFSYYPSDDRQAVDDPRIRIHSSTPLALVAWLFPLALVFGLLSRVAGRGVLRFAPAAIRALGESDCLVDLAGVSFIDGREKFLPFNILTLLPAWLLGTPIAKMPQAMGPFDRPLNRLAARLVLPLCDQVWARGERTAEHLAAAAIPGLDAALADDIAFNYDGRWSLTNEGREDVARLLDEVHARREAPGTRGVIGVCPSSVVAAKSRQSGGRYEDLLAEVVDALSRAGFIVLLFPNATRARAGGTERNNDLPLIGRVVAAVGGAAPLAVDFDVDAAGIKRIIAAMDVVLVSRFHAMVGALSLGVPTVVMGWSHKYAEVMARFGLEDFVLDYANAVAGGLAGHLEEAFERRGAIRDRVLERLPAVQTSAARPLRNLPGMGQGTRPVA